MFCGFFRARKHRVQLSYHDFNIFLVLFSRPISSLLLPSFDTVTPRCLKKLVFFLFIICESTVIVAHSPPITDSSVFSKLCPGHKSCIFHEAVVFSHHIIGVQYVQCYYNSITRKQKRLQSSLLRFPFHDSAFRLFKLH